MAGSVIQFEKPNGGILTHTPERTPTIPEALREATNRFGDRPFILFEDRVLSYREIESLAQAIAGSLYGLGVRKGDPVGVLMVNSLEMLGVFYATAILGALYTPIITGSKRPEISYVLEHSEAKILIIDAEHWEYFKDFRDDFPHLRKVIVDSADPGPGTERLADLIAGGGSAPPTSIDDGDDLCLLYTSGSTGRPKGVLLKQRSYARVGHSIAQRCEYKPESVILGLLPFFHAASICYSIASTMDVGASNMLVRRWKTGSFWEWVDRYGATAGLVFPSMMHMLMSQPADARDREHSLEQVVTHFRNDDFAARFNVDILTTWGLTESGAVGTMSSSRYPDYPPKMVGWPMTSEMRIRIESSDGKELAIGEAGEIVIKNDCLMSAYFKEPELTAKTLVDGWLHTGDVGRLDAHGRLYFEGRMKNIIKRSGENISGEEVEAVLTAHEGVIEAAVYALPDPMRTEEVAAAVVPQPGYDLTAEALVDWCLERLSGFKVPRFIAIVSELPKTPTQKIQRHVVQKGLERSSYWDRLEAGYRIERGAARSPRN
jgi:acyl-CoA synthetase (AMP-forming)/AMP-acid ligase II